MQAAVETGVDIPGQISLIGFDDVSFASLPKIQLTTISQPKEEICEAAVQTLEELIAADGPARLAARPLNLFWSGEIPADLQGAEHSGNPKMRGFMKR